MIFFAIITSAESPESEQEVRQFRVLDSQEVDLGDRSIIFNRVETPILKPQPVPLATPAPTPAPIPSAEEEEAIEEMRRRFPNLVGTLTPEEAEEMMHLIDEEFGQIDPDQWK